MEKKHPLIVSVTGWSGSGKTTFCEKLIAELLSRGIKTAAAKNAHQNLQTDKPGSDSERYFKAGADAVCLNAGNSMTVFYRNRLEDGNGLYSLFPEAEIIIAEGFKADDALRVELTGDISSSTEMKNPASDAELIIYSDEQLAKVLRRELCTEHRVSFVHRDDITSAADIICNR